MVALALAFALATTLTAAAPPGYAQRGEFKGKKILFVNYYEGSYTANVPKKLEELGFSVDVRVTHDHLPELSKYDQLWMVSSCSNDSVFDQKDVARILAFVKDGKG